MGVQSSSQILDKGGEYEGLGESEGTVDSSSKIGAL